MLEQLCRDGERFERERDEARRERDDLRAVLAPLLDDPIVWVWNGRREYRRCGVCDATATDPDLEPFPHHPDCPVLRRDELLGRG